MKRWIPALAVAAATTLLGPPAWAQATTGEVMKIDKSQQKITLKHEEIKNLDMPAMTMVFRVQDAAALDKIKVGDRVRFEADKVGGQYTVTRLTPAN